MFKKLFWACGLAFLACFILVIGYIIGQAMWLECSTWYGQLLTILSILTFIVGGFAILEEICKKF